MFWGKSQQANPPAKISNRGHLTLLSSSPKGEDSTWKKPLLAEHEIINAPPSWQDNGDTKPGFEHLAIAIAQSHLVPSSFTKSFALQFASHPFLLTKLQFTSLFQRYRNNFFPARENHLVEEVWSLWSLVSSFFLFCQVVDLTGCLPHLKASGLVKLTCAWVATCNPHLFSFQDNTSSCCFSANGNYVRWLAMLTKPPLCCLRHQLFATSPLPRLLSPCLALVCDIKHTANATLSAAG